MKIQVKNYQKKAYYNYTSNGEIECHYTETKVQDKTTQTSRILLTKLTTQSKTKVLLISNEKSKRSIQTVRIVWFAEQEHKVRSKNCYKFEL